MQIFSWITLFTWNVVLVDEVIRSKFKIDSLWIFFYNKI